jgi:carboxypeptidase PM20D1
MTTLDPQPVRRLLRRLAALLLLSLGALITALLVKAALWGSVQVHPAPVAPPALDGPACAQRLSQAIALETIADPDPDKVDLAPFQALHRHLEASFPRTHASLKREVIHGGSLLFTWEGRDKEAAAGLLAAHLDVVPVEPGTQERWTHPPFSGAIEDGFIWGRGAMDDKFSALAILEAVEHLLVSGFQPAHTLYLAFGHDEEVGGHRGAEAMSQQLQARGVKLDWVLDEGLVITEGIVPGLESPAALVGVAHKGYLSLELVARSEGGHSSMPPRETAVGILSHALARLEDHPMPARLDGAAEGTFRALGPEMPFLQKLAFANLWLLRPVVIGQLTNDPSTNSLVRTTTAPTMLEGSVQDNVLPEAARAVVNFRLLPGDSSREVIEHVTHTVHDERITINALGGLGDEPSEVSSPQAAPYKVLETTLREVYPDAVVAPGLFIAIGDARHYAPLTRNTYRFLPLRMRPEDRPRFHGTDERIKVEHYLVAIAF